MNPASLHLGDTSEEHLRQLVLLPFNSQQHILAYGGEDGSISVIENETTVKTARRFHDTIRSIAVSSDGKRVAVGLGDGSITIFVYSKLEGDIHPFLAAMRKSDAIDDDDFFSQVEGMEETSDDETSFLGPRFQTPVRSLAFDPRNNNLLACGSEDSGFCIVDTTSSETLSKKRFLQEESAEEHNETGVRGLAYNLSDKQVLLASLDLQGRVCVWNVSGDDPELDYELMHKDNHKSVTKVDLGIINDSEPADQASIPIFGGKFLGLPGCNDVQLRALDKIEKQLFVPSMEGGKGHIEPIVSLSFSETGENLVTAGRDGRICSWKLNPKENDFSGKFVQIVAEIQDICTSILWVGKKIYFAFANGTFSVVDAKKKVLSTVESSERKEHVNGKDAAEKESNSENKKDILSDDEDVNFEETNTPKPKALFIDDEAGEDDALDSNNPNDTMKIISENAPESPSELKADEGSVLGGEEEGEELEDDDHTYQAKGQYIQKLELPEPQSAFAPSSTPLELTRRIMCWNHIGTVTSHRNDETTTRNTIDITFTDAAFKRPISFTDNMDFIIGSLGEDGAFFSTDVAQGNDDEILNEDIEKVVDGLNISARTKEALQKSQKKRMQKDKGKPAGSSLYFHRFETFGNLSNKDWVITLPDGELAVGGACGEGWAACITNRRFLRIFSSGGNQGPIVWLDGEPVTIVGRGRQIAVFYHESAPLPDGTQKLAYSIFDGISTEKLFSGPLSCISSRSSMTWAGFSKEGSLMAMDSDGMLSMLVTIDNNENKTDTFRWNWTPILDTVGLRKSIEDSFWPVAVQDGKLICVPLKGGNEYPDATRRPITTALGFRMPLAYGSDKNLKIEELAVRAKLSLNQKKYILTKTASDGYDVDDLDVEYRALCAQVDKVTLKLYMANLESGKVERALDLTNRLHLEKSFDIAIHLADRTNHRNLSDKVESIKDRRFQVNDDQSIEEQFSITGDEDFDHRTPTHSQQSNNVSPDTKRNSGSKRSHKEVESDDEISNTRRTLNPFAKKRFESPARPAYSPKKKNSSRIGISRLSSFSAQSRSISKGAKNLL